MDVARPTIAPPADRKVTTSLPRAGGAEIRVRSQPFSIVARAMTAPRKETVAVTAEPGARARTAPKNAS